MDLIPCGNFVCFKYNAWTPASWAHFGSNKCFNKFQAQLILHEGSKLYPQVEKWPPIHFEIKNMKEAFCLSFKVAIEACTANTLFLISDSD